MRSILFKSSTSPQRGPDRLEVASAVVDGEVAGNKHQGEEGEEDAEQQPFNPVVGQQRELSTFLHSITKQ